MNLYRLFWDEFSSWYLEIVKPAYQKPVDKTTYEATLSFFEQLMELLHPIMPFITEEIWQLIYERESGESIMITEMPEKGAYDTELLDSFEKVKEIIASVRNIRKDKDIPNKEALTLKVNGEHIARYDPVVQKLANISSIEEISSKPENAVSFMVRTTEYYIPVESLLDTEEEVKKLEEELEYTRGFLQSVMKKLNNERFVQNAPANVVDLEKKKKEDAEQKIKTLEERINSLKN